MRIAFERSRWLDIASKAADSGAVMRQHAGGLQPHVHWDIAGDCSNPVYRELRAAKRLNGDPGDMRTNQSRSTEITHSQHLEMEVRCRKCPACLRQRSRIWAARARAETKASTRTWFGTLTFRPEAQFLALSQARHRLAAQGVDFDAEADHVRFAERHRALQPAITKYLKRVRKESGSPLRYLLVVEAHKSGAPHYHMLIHEVSVLTPIRHSLLKKQWRDGFSDFKLVDQLEPRAVAYVCKYLSKSASSRVRASQGYGQLA